jgi:hypothetical protein
MRLPRVLSAVALAAAMATPLIPTSQLFAQAPAPAPAANPDAPPPLTPAAATVSPAAAAAENFWHYAKIAKYDLAAAEGQKLLEANTPAPELLQAFQAVARDRRDDLFETLFRWLNVEPMKDVTQKLIAKLKEGQLGQVTDYKWIAGEVARLSVNERAFEMAIANLRNAGEFAAPVMIDVLRDQGKRNLHSATRRGLVRLGRQVLNPLVVVLDSKDQGTLITVIGVLADIGYPDAAPYIARLAASNDPGMGEVKSAAGRALARLGGSGQNPAQMFYDLAEKFYYGSVSIVADPRFADAHVWYWDDAKGLMNKDVPTPIFGDIMSMRAAEQSLKLDPSKAETVSLWLAANNKREADLPEGKTDATHSGPDAHFYNVAMGTQYCNAVLSRALNDRTTPVALKAVKSLQEIVGQANIFQGASADGKEPIVAAMQFPDRLVRFEAAMTLAAALPQQPFNGLEQVVPTLAEAVGASGRPNLVIVAPDANAATAVKESLKDAVRAETASDAGSAAAAAGRLPSVDVLLVDTRGNDQADTIVASPSLKNVPKVMIVESKASPFVAAELNDMRVNTLVAGAAGTAPDAAALTTSINKARTRAGSAVMDEKASEAYAQRAAALLERLAISRGQVLDVSVAAPALMRALEDPRLEVAKSTGNVLAMINTKESQAAIAGKALDEKAPEDLKVSLFKSLARSAKFWGNQLDPNTTDALQKVVGTAENLQVRAAAAEAQGALNLPADRAKDLIINRIGK